MTQDFLFVRENKYLRDTHDTPDIIANVGAGPSSGWRLKNQPKFSPTDPTGVAHDCLEHFTNGSDYQDELMAVGAAIFVRGFNLHKSKSYDVARALHSIGGSMQAENTIPLYPIPRYVYANTIDNFMHIVMRNYPVHLTPTPEWVIVNLLPIIRKGWADAIVRYGGRTLHGNSK